MDALYHEELLEHYKFPQNRGKIENPDFAFTDKNPLCGDVCHIDVRVKNDKIEAIKFDASGCAISQAATSMLCDAVEGKPLEEVKKMGKEELLKLVGIELGPVRLKCALLCLKVLKSAVYGIKDWPT
ncbi:MAG: SUF system NifU family Fe-S cluster assembly protein [Deltaproteobacteria bacterium]|nr:SUF system NifU family Fe-S cluster assembly protein [Deltaproteobacteria bacterium]